MASFCATIIGDIPGERGRPDRIRRRPADEIFPSEPGPHLVEDLAQVANEA